MDFWRCCVSGALKPSLVASWTLVLDQEKREYLFVRFLILNHEESASNS